MEWKGKKYMLDDPGCYRTGGSSVCDWLANGTRVCLLATGVCMFVMSTHCSVYRINVMPSVCYQEVGMLLVSFS
jgi:hypothetical protein